MVCKVVRALRSAENMCTAWGNFSVTSELLMDLATVLQARVYLCFKPFVAVNVQIFMVVFELWSSFKLVDSQAS